MGDVKGLWAFRWSFRADGRGGGQQVRPHRRARHASGTGGHLAAEFHPPLLWMRAPLPLCCRKCRAPEVSMPIGDPRSPPGGTAVRMAGRAGDRAAVCIVSLPAEAFNLLNQ